MKKILIVALHATESCPVFSLELVQSLVNNHCDVYAVIPDNIDNKTEWIKTLSLDKIGFVHNDNGTKKALRSLLMVKNVSSFFLFSKTILKNIVNVDFDCTIYTFFHRWNSLIKNTVKSEQSILMVHDPILHSYESSRRVKEQHQQLSTMDKAIVLSKSFISILENDYSFSKNKIIYMPHGIMHSNVSDKSVSISPYSEINFLFFGRIHEYKGIGNFINASLKLQNNLSFKVTIAGNGDFNAYKDNFDRLKNAILINRYIEDEEIPDLFLEENTVLVIPYIDATQSGVIATAFTYGVPTIATKTDGLWEQLDCGRLGFFCEPDSIEALANTMQYILNNKAELLVQSDLMKKHSETLSWDVIAKQLLLDIEATN